MMGMTSKNIKIQTFIFQCLLLQERIYKPKILQTSYVYLFKTEL